MRSEICGQTCINKSKAQYSYGNRATTPWYTYEHECHEDTCLHTKRFAIACSHICVTHESSCLACEASLLLLTQARRALTVLDVRDDVNPVLDLHPQLVQLTPQVLQLVDVRLSQALPTGNVPKRRKACCRCTAISCCNVSALVTTAVIVCFTPVVADVADVLIDDCLVRTAAGAQRINKVIHEQRDGANVIRKEGCKGLLVIVVLALACRSTCSAEYCTQQACCTSFVLGGVVHTCDNANQSSTSLGSTHLAQ